MVFKWQEKQSGEEKSFISLRQAFCNALKNGDYRCEQSVRFLPSLTTSLL